MRLLNTRSLRLEVFQDECDVPSPYAILSHTWDDQETTFHDFTTSTNPDMTKPGWWKIHNACRHAAGNGWEYIWIDTCCINKSDTTELSEAVNSMFRWYERAGVCYAFLADLALPGDENNTGKGVDFRQSRWFTRGWTLQELLAPRMLEFLDSEWNPIGSREDWASEIEVATGIKREHLTDFHQCSIATKLSWAANRLTTRIEDHSYSLLGLLGVYMPLIYGEREHAFTRLQHELIRKYNDESIFAWEQIYRRSDSFAVSIGPNLGMAPIGSVLAKSPRNFRHKLEIKTHQCDRSRLHFGMTNAGLSLRAEVFVNLAMFGVHQPIYLIELNCSYIGHTSPMVLLLQDADPNKTLALALISSDYFPLAFRKIQYQALDLQSVFTSMGDQWASRGWHDIIIVEEKSVLGVSGPTSSSKPFCFLQQQEVRYQLNGFQLFTRIGGFLSHILIPPPNGQPLALEQGQVCMFNMIVRSYIRRRRYGSRLERDAHYLVILKWESRSLICGIWSSPEGSPNFLNSIGKAESVPFPTRAPGPTPETEIQLLVSTQLDKHAGVSYAISIRRRVLRVPSSTRAPHRQES